MLDGQMSFDNKFFATGAVGGVVTLWDAYTYAPISHGIGHSNDVTGTPAIPRRSPAALPKSHLCVAAVRVVGAQASSSVRMPSSWYPPGWTATRLCGTCTAKTRQRLARVRRGLQRCWDLVADPLLLYRFIHKLVSHSPT